MPYPDLSLALGQRVNLLLLDSALAVLGYLLVLWEESSGEAPSPHSAEGSLLLLLLY